MVGIISCGAYIPRYRIARQTISAAMGWLNRYALAGEKAVTNYDEDSLTMAVAASMNCVGTADRAKIDGLYFATTTAPYRERESAAIVATALALPSAVHTVDLGNSLKAGTSAALLSCGAVKAGDRENVLVCAADCRLGKPGSSQEVVFGDAAAALLIGSEQVIASLEGSYSLSYDFPDHWRAAFDRFDRTLEDRWIRDEGYTRFISEAITGLLKKYKLEPGKFARVIYPCLYLREHATIGRKLGFDLKTQVQDTLFNTVGNTGTASALQSLVAALEEAKAGDRILLASYGNGCDVFILKITEEIERAKNRRGIKGYLQAKQTLSSYQQYLRWRNIIEVQPPARPDPEKPSAPALWRDNLGGLALYGSKCCKCGTIAYPIQRVCLECGTKDDFDYYNDSRLS